MSSSSIEKAPSGENPSLELSLLLGVVVLGLASQLLFATPYGVGQFGDDAAYLLQAWRLGYGGSCPVCQQAVPNTPYMTGWPLVMAPFVPLFGGRLELYRLIPLGLMVAGVALASSLFRRHASPAATLLFAATLFLCQGLLDYGSSLMCESLYLFIAMMLLALDRPEENRRRDVLSGVLAGFAGAVRPEGLILATALLLALALRRRWKPVLVVLLTAIFVYKTTVLVFAPLPSGQVGQIQDFFRGGVAASEYVKAWAWNHLLLLGRCFVLLPAGFGRLLGASVIALALVGVARRPQESDAFPVLILMGTGAAMLIWPFLNSRYWVMSLPIWLLLGLGRVGAKLQTAALCGLLVLQIATLLHRPPPPIAPESVAELYSALSRVGRDELVATTYPARVQVQGHRTWGRLEAAESLGIFARNQNAVGARVILWEKQSGLVVNHEGRTQFRQPAHLDQWLARSSLFEKVFENEAGVIARLVAPPEQLERAFELWGQANSIVEPAPRLAKLDQARTALDDVPEIRVVWALTALESPSTMPRGIGELRRYFRQYPHDFEVAPLIISTLARLGQARVAREIADLCLAEANRLGDARATEAIAAARASIAP